MPDYDCTWVNPKGCGETVGVSRVSCCRARLGGPYDVHARPFIGRNCGKDKLNVTLILFLVFQHIDPVVFFNLLRRAGLPCCHYLSSNSSSVGYDGNSEPTNPSGQIVKLNFLDLERDLYNKVEIIGLNVAPESS